MEPVCMESVCMESVWSLSVWSLYGVCLYGVTTPIYSRSGEKELKIYSEGLLQRFYDDRASHGFAKDCRTGTGLGHII